MKQFNFIPLAVFGMALALATTGCHTTKPGVTPLPNGSGGPGGSGNDLNNGGAVPGETVPPGGGDTANFDPDQMTQDRSAFSADIVYFDYDSATIKGSEASKLEAIATALKSDASAKLLVEGNCDERGTEEYNRSLGERRALAAREALANAGVDASKIATRSYGEDRPADPGHTQASWAKNRRDEFVLLHPR
jgi:peptidoglycan-associated lipoprotein